jgi:hypothetical protein
MMTQVEFYQPGTTEKEEHFVVKQVNSPDVMGWTAGCCPKWELVVLHMLLQERSLCVSGLTEGLSRCCRARARS